VEPGWSRTDNGPEDRGRVPITTDLLAAINLIEAVARWQLDTLVHPLTCGTESDHRPLLLPCWDADRQTVYLWCAACNYRQDWIPEWVLDHTREHVKPGSFPRLP